MDDEYVILNNKQVHKGVSAIPEIFRTTYAIESKASFEYRPIVKATYAIEYEIFGENPYVSHTINILLYVFCLVLLFYVLLRLIPGYHYLFHLTVVLLFLVHPLHSEVVLSLKNRDVMLSFTGTMFSLLFYLRFIEGKGYLNLLVGFLFLLFALMSKKDSMTFFAIVPFTMWFFRKVSWKQIGWIFISYLPVVLTFRFAAKSLDNENVRELMLWENPMFINHLNFFERIPQGFYSVYFYLKMFLIPHPLIAYYGYNQVPIVGWDNIIVWLTFILMGGTLYFVIKKKALKEVWVYGIIYFLVTISMFTNVVKPVVGIVGERFAFLPSLGLCILAAYFLLTGMKVAFSKHEMKLQAVNGKFWLLLVLIVIGYGGRTIARNADWKDAYTLYKADAENATESAHTHTLLAASAISKAKSHTRMTQAEKRKLILEAEYHYLESIRLIPDYIASHNNLGMLYYSFMNSPEKALKHLLKAIELKPDYVEAYFNAATAYAALKQFEKAEEYYLKSIQLDPNFANTYLSLSNVYASRKEYDKILKLNLAAIEKGVKTDVIYINISNVYYMNGDTLQALPYLEKAISMNPNNKGVNKFLAEYYRSKGDAKKSAYYADLMKKSI
jgi:Tfp pilus assembly protein PilF